jgi:hypothetical protein
VPFPQLDYERVTGIKLAQQRGKEMKRRTVIFLLAGGAAACFMSGLAWAACSGIPKCPIHDLDMTFTGHQKFENNHFWYLYHCTGGGRNGHDVWVRCD